MPISCKNVFVELADEVARQNKGNIRRVGSQYNKMLQCCEYLEKMSSSFGMEKVLFQVYEDTLDIDIIVTRYYLTWRKDEDEFLKLCKCAKGISFTSSEDGTLTAVFTFSNVWEQIKSTSENLGGN